MSLTPDEHVLVAPEEVLEGDRASLITGMAIARAWRNPGYRDRLVTAPRDVLAEDGLEIPESMTIRVFEDTPTVKHVSITTWTSEPEELALLFRGVVPLPAGGEVRLVQNTAEAVCLVVPLAAPEPELVTDVERLRKLAPRASVFATAESLAAASTSVSAEAIGEVSSVAASVATEFGSSASAAAAATAHAATETETATATATASGLASGTIGGGSVYASGVQLATASGSAQISGAILVLSSGSVSSSASSSASTSASSDTAVSTQTYEVTNATTFAEIDVSIVSEGASATLALEAEAVATTTTLGAEAEVVAVAVIVVT